MRTTAVLNELLADKEKPFWLAGLKTIIIENLDSLTNEYMEYFLELTNENCKYAIKNTLPTKVDIL